jgi:hypothetical protein
MSEFQKETRYIVLKLSKLTDHQKTALGAVLAEINLEESAMPECVVVEHDWPNFDETWAAIQAISEGGFVSGKELVLERDRLRRDLDNSEENARQQSAMKVQARQQRNEVMASLLQLKAAAVNAFDNWKNSQDIFGAMQRLKNTYEAKAEDTLDDVRAHVALDMATDFRRYVENGTYLAMLEYAVKLKKGE